MAEARQVKHQAIQGSGPEDEAHLLDSLPLRAPAGGVGDLIAGLTILARKSKRARRGVVNEATRVATGDCPGFFAVDAVGLDVVPAGAGTVLAAAVPPVVCRRRWGQYESQADTSEQDEALQAGVSPHGSALPTTSPLEPTTPRTRSTAASASVASRTAVRWSLTVQLPGALVKPAIAGPIVGIPAPWRAWAAPTADSLVTVTLNRGIDATVPEPCSAQALDETPCQPIGCARPTKVGPRAANAGPVAPGIALTKPDARGRLFARSVSRQREAQQ